MQRLGQGIFASFALLTLVLGMSSARALEVSSRDIGPRSVQPLRGFNVNYFDFNKVAVASLDCKQTLKTKRCPADMTAVCSEHFKTAVCMDTDLLNDPNTGRPQGNMNLYACEAACAAQGKRIPKNNEWLVACTGTQPSACLTYGRAWPPGQFEKIPGHVCQTHGATSSACMTSQDLVNELPPVSPACVSEAGVRGCVGTFHQWVTDHVIGAEHGYKRFNGGSFVVPASAVEYVTPAHTNDFYHYANGCRCARDL